MDNFKNNWNKVYSGKEWFAKELPSVLSKMYNYEEVSQSFYDDHGFPLDMDHAGNMFRLKSSSDHMTRSKVLFYLSIIAKKKEDIRIYD